MREYCFFELAKSIYRRLTLLAKNPEEMIKNEIRILLEKAIDSLIKQPNNFFTLCKKFSLLYQEQLLVFLAVCSEIEPRILHFLSNYYLNFNKNYLSCRLLDSLLEDDISIPFDSILFREKLIHIDKKSGFYLMDTAVRVSDGLLHFLLDIDPIDSQLTRLLAPISYSPSATLIDNYKASLNILTKNLTQKNLTLLIGEDESFQEMLISQLNLTLSRKIYFIATHQLPDNNGELYHCIQALRQEALLRNTLYCFSLHALDLNKKEWLISTFINYLYQSLAEFCVIISKNDFFSSETPVIKIILEKSSHQQWKIVWQHFLAKSYPKFHTAIDAIIEHFELTVNQIRKIATSINSSTDERDGDDNILWQHCRESSQKTLTYFTTPIQTTQWDNLILPDTQTKLLDQLITQVKNRFLVYRKWGLASKEGRGLGITALFFGSSGTGKTMAAEAIANRLQLDLYRINLGQIISKYIGETQKNLEKIFSLAEKSCAILLFDEADGLFGKRSDIKESRDRYANMEVNYLLSRMENYNGLSLLTSNLKDNIDSAFLRRFRFVIEFYYPNQAQREILWNKLLTAPLPFKNIDCKRLANIDINGASIRNVIINAAFLAAQHKEILTMNHLKEAMLQEFIKLERPLIAEINNL